MVLGWFMRSEGLTSRLLLGGFRLNFGWIYHQPHLAQVKLLDLHEDGSWGGLGLI